MSNECTGTQSAREGPAKPSLVSSTLTPCSKDQVRKDLLQELVDRWWLLDWDFGPTGQAEEFLTRVKEALK